jgi:hypothetical protein
MPACRCGRREEKWEEEEEDEKRRTTTTMILTSATALNFPLVHCGLMYVCFSPAELALVAISS